MGYIETAGSIDDRFFGIVRHEEVSAQLSDTTIRHLGDVMLNSGPDLDEDTGYTDGREDPPIRPPVRGDD